MGSLKNINGRTYRFVQDFSTKVEATKEAKQLRKSWSSVRVIKGLRGKGYSVYRSTQ